MIRIWADFNALDGDLIPLDFKGSFADIRQQKVELREGLHIMVYDDGYRAEGIVEKVKNRWYARIVPGTGQAADASPPPLDQ
jgi:hypothetical protein